jgi:CRISPR-associated protein Cas1
VPVLCAALMLLMLGPGTTITHAAVGTLADNGCLVVWTGERGVRMYAQGFGETQSITTPDEAGGIVGRRGGTPENRSTPLREAVSEPVGAALTLQQIRGMEGVRCGTRTQRPQGNSVSNGRDDSISDRTGDPRPRSTVHYRQPIVASTVCAAPHRGGRVLASVGIHSYRQMLSFVYDVADLYKTDVTVPVAFRSIGEGAGPLEATIQLNLRDRFAETRLLSKVVNDLAFIFDESLDNAQDSVLDEDEAHPGGLWDPEGEAAGGVNWADPLDVLKRDG